MTTPTPADAGASGAADATRLRARALRLLARREHGRDELRRKLTATPRRRGAPGAMPSDADGAAEADPRERAAALGALVDALLDELQDRGLLSDARCVEVFAHSAAPRLGRARLEQALGRRGLSLGLLDDERRAQLAASEPARAQALLRRRWGEAPPADDHDAHRRWRFLVSRGFAPDLARRLVQTAGRARRGSPEGDEAPVDTAFPGEGAGPGGS